MHLNWNLKILRNTEGHPVNKSLCRKWKFFGLNFLRIIGNREQTWKYKATTQDESTPIHFPIPPVYRFSRNFSTFPASQDLNFPRAIHNIRLDSKTSEEFPFRNSIKYCPCLDLIFLIIYNLVCRYVVSVHKFCK